MAGTESFLEKFALEGNIRVLVLQTLISQVGFGMFLVIWQPLILSTGATVAKLGAIQSLINLVTAVGLIFWGSLSDRFGRKPVIIASYLCRIFAIAVLIATGSGVFLYVFAFFVGLSSLFYQSNPAVSALISESVGSEKRATAFSAINTISRLTSTLVASIGGYIAVEMGYIPILYIALVGDILGTVVIVLFVQETYRNVTNQTRRADIEMNMIRKHLIPESGLLRLYAISLVIGFAYNTGYSVLFGMLVDNLGFTELQLGFLITTFSLVAAATAIPLGRLSDRQGRKPMLKMGVAMGVTSVTGYILSRRFEHFLLFYTIGALDWNFYILAWMPLVSEMAPPESLSTVLGKLDSYSRFAGIIGPWFGGQLYNLYGFRVPLLVHLVGIMAYGILVFTLPEE